MALSENSYGRIMPRRNLRAEQDSRKELEFYRQFGVEGFTQEEPNGTQQEQIVFDSRGNNTRATELVAAAAQQDLLQGRSNGQTHH